MRHDQGTAPSVVKDIEELQTAMEDFSGIPFAAGTLTREDAIKLLEYIWSIVRIAKTEKKTIQQSWFRYY
jgi:hypothetical protein